MKTDEIEDLIESIAYTVDPDKQISLMRKLPFRTNLYRVAARLNELRNSEITKKLHENKRKLDLHKELAELNTLRTRDKEMISYQQDTIKELQHQNKNLKDTYIVFKKDAARALELSVKIMAQPEEPQVHLWGDNAPSK